MPLIPVRKAVLALAPYNAPEEGRARMRLDFNENTVGCSPAFCALSPASRGTNAIYPEYQETTKRLARFFAFGRPEEMQPDKRN